MQIKFKLNLSIEAFCIGTVQLEHVVANMYQDIFYLELTILYFEVFVLIFSYFVQSFFSFVQENMVERN